jgi:hypothetical protein
MTRLGCIECSKALDRKSDSAVGWPLCPLCLYRALREGDHKSVSFPHIFDAASAFSVEAKVGGSAREEIDNDSSFTNVWIHATHTYAVRK